jgi:nitrite reductase (NO-forming)
MRKSSACSRRLAPFLVAGMSLAPLPLLAAGPGPAPSPAPHAAMPTMSHEMPNAVFTLRTGITHGKMVYIGKGGDIEGKVNPTLTVHEGDIVQITLVNGEGAEHDINLVDFHVASQRVTNPGASSTLMFHANDIGTFQYFCTVAGHREAGMQGMIKVEPATPKEPDKGVSISRDPADMPPPVGERGPTTVRYDLEAIERVGQLDEKTTYDFWTFNGKVPGPMLRVRVGDTVVLSLKNAPDSVMMHNIDLHAVEGPGGGAVLTEVSPDETKSFTFKATQPGLFVYHCATPMVSAHISNGMYGMILVEPVAALPKVDHEFYVMQGELYTAEANGHTGLQEFSVDKLMDERPEYFVFNGAVGALTTEHPLHAKTGETVRIYFGVGGPNFTSSFHVIGAIFDRVYNAGSVTSPPLTSVQTTSVPPGGATIVDLSVPVPGRYVLVDHALVRMEKGLVGALIVDGPPAPEIFHEGDSTQTVTHTGH